MKKGIFLRIILLIELTILIVFTLGKVIPGLQNVIIVNYLYYAGEWFYSFMKTIMHALSLDKAFLSMWGNDLQNIVCLITLVLFNLVFIGVYYLVFGILTLVINKATDKKVHQVVSPYELTSNEADKFSYKNYLRRFPLKRTVSIIIPLSFILIFLFIRFDKTICFENGSKLSGGLNIYNDYLRPFFIKLFSGLDWTAWLNGVMHNGEGHGYIDLMNNILGNMTWVEYIFLIIASALIMIAWFGLFTLIHLTYKKPYAKYRSKKAIEAYKRKMELIEYKLHNKYKDETNIKADDFMHIVETEQQAAAKEIAKFKKDVDSQEAREAKDAEAKKQAYYEEIGQGVTDLGVSDEKIDLDKPLVERQVKYIADEDIDIILDEEPLIEVVEDQDEATREVGKNDIFFEKYQPDDVEIGIIEEYSGEKLTKEEVHETPLSEETKEEVKEPVEEIKEEPVEEVKEETKEEPVEEVKEETKEEPVEEVKEEPVEEVKQEDIVDDTTESALVEEKAPEEAKNEETEPKPKKTFADYIGRKNKGGNGEVKVPPLDNGDKPKVSSGFAQYIGRKNKAGYGAKKVPSFKAIKEEEEALAKQKAMEKANAKKPSPKKKTTK